MPDVTLRNFLRAIAVRAGAPSNLVDVSAVDADLMVHGYAIDDMTFTAKDVYDDIYRIYNVEISQDGGKVKFVPRGQESIDVEIPLDDLIEGELKIDREDSINVPRYLRINYAEVNGGLQEYTQASERVYDRRATGEEQIDTKFFLTADEATQAVAIRHKVLIQDQSAVFEFGLPMQYSYLMAGSIIKIDGQRARIAEINDDNGDLQIRAISDRYFAYQSDATGDIIPEPELPEGVEYAHPRVEILNIPFVDPNHDEAVYYIAMCPSNPQGWIGSQVQVNYDYGGIDRHGFIPPSSNYYSTPVDLASSAIVGEYINWWTEIGGLTTPLPAMRPEVLDEASVIEVQFPPDMQFTFQDATLQEMQEGKNLAVVGDELINFGSAEDLGDGLWRFSEFLRGRRFSDVKSHPVGTRFVIADDMIPVKMPLERRSNSSFYLGKIKGATLTTYGVYTPLTVAQSYAPQLMISQRSFPPLLLSIEDTGDPSGKMATVLLRGLAGVGSISSLGSYEQLNGVTIGIYNGAVLHNATSVPFSDIDDGIVEVSIPTSIAPNVRFCVITLGQHGLLSDEVIY